MIIMSICESQIQFVDDLFLKKTLELYNIIIFVWFVFNDAKKHYPQIFLDEYLY